MRILVLGAGGMLGNAVFRVMCEDGRHEVFGTVRSPASARKLADLAGGTLLPNVDVLDNDALVSVLSKARPEVVVNCVGLVKQLSDAKDPLAALPINALLPHRLARLGAVSGARVVHISTDCVFSGRRGHYCEDDLSDAEDLYGKSKYIGELHDYPNAVTLRTSIIGHELASTHALVDWFLSQSGEVNGYRRAIFSGLPTVELAHVIRDVVIPQPKLSGLFHVSASPIAKFDLLQLIAKAYSKAITIVPNDDVVIDRSLDSSRFTRATNYSAPAWPTLIARMKEFR